MRIIQRLGVVAACLGGLTTSSVQAQWEQVEPPELKAPSEWAGLLALGPRDVWAAGSEDGHDGVSWSYEPGAKNAGRPVLQRWDGSRWARTVIGRRFQVSAFDADGPDDAWVVGNHPIDASQERAYTYHWDGARWREIGLLSAEEGRVHDVATDRGQVVLLGRDRNDYATGPRDTSLGYRSFALSWDGRQTRVAVGREGTFESVDSGAGHTWIAGAKPRRNCDGIVPAIWHRPAPDSPFEEVKLPLVPDGHLVKVRQNSPSDVWAVGTVGYSEKPEFMAWSYEPWTACRATGPWTYPFFHYQGAPGFRPLVLHWDGTAWRRMELPDWQGGLLDVTASAAGGMWAVGHDPAHADRLMIVHYDGRRWTREYVRTGEVYDAVLAQVPGTDQLWLIGQAASESKRGDVMFRRRAR
ncbi:hypothetical protein [Nonomuraea sp. NPDC049695]|uniref:hypothetical protein n=1 Tax=Nonomuraea sp. NPDC049695 TaxID=3154734 RepID=UPI0034197AAD